MSSSATELITEGDLLADIESMVMIRPRTGIMVSKPANTKNPIKLRPLPTGCSGVLLRQDR